MSFRARLTLVAAAAVALAVVVGSIVVYFVVRDELYSQVDSTLENRAEGISRLGLNVDPEGRHLAVPPPLLTGGYIQAVRSNGEALTSFFNVPLPVDERVREVAGGQRKAFFTDAEVGGAKLRVLTVPFDRDYALQVSQSLTGVDKTLHRVTIFLIIIAAGGIAVALGLGLLVSRAALAPVRRLTSATERVTETGDLSERIAAGGEDELSRLAGSFNTMLGALDESRRVQRQLVEDASHELRTPLTSLRTNIEVLASERTLPAEERARLLSDVVEQLGEMTVLVGELLELARGEQHAGEAEDVRLDLLAGEAVERARRNSPGITFTTDFRESLVHGIPATIERALGNLLDNAAKWSPPGGEVEVAVRNGTVSVRDHGPGIDEEDLPYVFDRFYRARSARGMPGSGLGLAIVKQIAEAHGGEVTAGKANGGGTLVTLRLSS